METLLPMLGPFAGPLYDYFYKTKPQVLVSIEDNKKITGDKHSEAIIVLKKSSSKEYISIRVVNKGHRPITIEKFETMFSEAPSAKTKRKKLEEIRKELEDIFDIYLKEECKRNEIRVEVNDARIYYIPKEIFKREYIKGLGFIVRVIDVTGEVYVSGQYF